jgi:hypothetical protein
MSERRNQVDSTGWQGLLLLAGERGEKKVRASDAISKQRRQAPRVIHQGWLCVTATAIASTLAWPHP